MSPFVHVSLTQLTGTMHYNIHGHGSNLGHLTYSPLIDEFLTIKLLDKKNMSPFVS